jgi:hypothetical protein
MMGQMDGWKKLHEKQPQRPLLYVIEPMHPNFPHLIKQYHVKHYQHKKIYVSINKLSLIHARIVYRFDV